MLHPAVKSKDCGNIGVVRHVLLISTYRRSSNLFFLGMMIASNTFSVGRHMSLQRNFLIHVKEEPVNDELESRDSVLVGHFRSPEALAEGLLNTNTKSSGGR